jgi:HSP20 family protein
MAIIPFRWVREQESDRAPLSSLQTEVNRLMDTFFTDWDLTPAETRAGAFQPQVDIVEREKDFLLHIDLPGVDENDVELSMHRNILTIKGERKFEKTESDKNYMRTERSYGSFVRSIPFAVKLDENKIEAHYKKGVLTVTLPKAPEALKESKKIQIKSSS